MTKLSMALSQRCLCSISRKVPSQSPSWSRCFSISSSIEEDAKPSTTFPRAKARLEAAEAVQQLARSRSTERQGPRIPGRSATDGPRIIRKSTIPVKTTQGAPSAATTSSNSGSPRFRIVRTASSQGTETTQRTFRAPQTSSAANIQSGSRDRPAGPSRGGSTYGGSRTARPSRRRRSDNDAESEGNRDRTLREADGDMVPSLEEHMELLKDLGYERAWQIKPAQGPHLDMASMMMEYAPKHFGATEPVTGQYPTMTDEKRRGLLQNIVRQARKNETYTEKDIDQLAKKLGPAMPRT